MFIEPVPSFYGMALLRLKKSYNFISQINCWVFSGKIADLIHSKSWAFVECIDYSPLCTGSHREGGHFAGDQFGETPELVGARGG